MIDLVAMTMRPIDRRPDGTTSCRVEGGPPPAVVVPRDPLAQALDLARRPDRS